MEQFVKEVLKRKAQKGDMIFSDEGPGGLALGNPIIMDKRRRPSFEALVT